MEWKYIVAIALAAIVALSGAAIAILIVWRGKPTNSSNDNNTTNSLEEDLGIPLVHDGPPLGNVILTTSDLRGQLYWPYTYLAWKEIIGVRPTLVVVTDQKIFNKNHWPHVQHVVRFHPEAGIPPKFQALCLRVMIPAMFSGQQDPIIMSANIHCLPLDKKGFHQEVLKSQMCILEAEEPATLPDYLVSYGRTWRDNIFPEVAEVAEAKVAGVAEAKVAGVVGAKVAGADRIVKNINDASIREKIRIWWTEYTTSASPSFENFVWKKLNHPIQRLFQDTPHHMEYPYFERTVEDHMYLDARLPATIQERGWERVVKKMLQEFTTVKDQKQERKVKWVDLEEK